MTIKTRLRFVQDSDPCNPRTYLDCYAGRMICFHSRYNLGDEHGYDSSDWKEEMACEADADLYDKLDYLREVVEDVIYDCLVSDGEHTYTSASEWLDNTVRRRCEELIDKAFDAGYVALPLYLYDHSGITMSTGGFSCPFDSGCVGVIVCDAETVEKEFGGDRDRAESALRAEVEEYDDYLTGNVWGWIYEKFEDDEWYVEDSCYGFYGRIDPADCAGYPDLADSIECAFCIGAADFADYADKLV